MVLRIPIRRKSRCWSLNGWTKLKLLREISRNSPAEEKVKRNWIDTIRGVIVLLHIINNIVFSIIIDLPECCKVPYLVRVKSETEIRKGPGTGYRKTRRKCPVGIFTIVEVKNGWGRRKSGAGWIMLSKTEKM